MHHMPCAGTLHPPMGPIPPACHRLPAPCQRYRSRQHHGSRALPDPPHHRGAQYHLSQLGHWPSQGALQPGTPCKQASGSSAACLGASHRHPSGIPGCMSCTLHLPAWLCCAPHAQAVIVGLSGRPGHSTLNDSLQATVRASWEDAPCAPCGHAPGEVGLCCSATARRIIPGKGAPVVQGGRKDCEHGLLADWEGTSAAQ